MKALLMRMASTQTLGTAFAAVIANLPEGTVMVPGHFTRPDGFNGHIATVRLALAADGRILEICPSGWYSCPAVSHEIDIASIEWLVDHHPNFSQYRRDQSATTAA